MIEQRATRVLTAGVVLALVLASCGDAQSAEERFCEIDAEMTEIGDFLHPDRDEARRASLRVRDLLAEAVEVAPDEIDDAVAVVAEGLNFLIDLLEDGDFREDEMDSARMLDAIAVSDFAVASQTMQRWADTNCSA